MKSMSHIVFLQSVKMMPNNIIKWIQNNKSMKMSNKLMGKYQKSRL